MEHGRLCWWWMSWVHRAVPLCLNTTVINIYEAYTGAVCGFISACMYVWKRYDDVALAKLFVNYSFLFHFNVFVTVFIWHELTLIVLNFPDYKNELTLSHCFHFSSSVTDFWIVSRFFTEQHFSRTVILLISFISPYYATPLPHPHPGTLLITAGVAGLSWPTAVLI